MAAERRWYLVLGTDRSGTAALREAVRPEHRAWLREHPGHDVTVLHGGPTLDADGAMDGTLLIVEAASEAAVRAFVDADPYVRKALFRDLQIRRWAWTLRASV